MRTRTSSTVCAITVAVSLVMLAGGSGQARPSPSSPSGADGVPSNTVLVLVDDMRTDDLEVLPNTREWLARNGVRFSAAYAPTPLCCPARATLLTGQYAHNTGVYDNLAGGIRPGGVSAFDDDLTMATVLNDSGVSTGYVGKYLNQYHHLWVPPGWSDWRAGIKDQYRYRHAGGWELGMEPGLAAYDGVTTYNVNGVSQTIEGYETTVQTDLSTQFIRDNATTPFLLMVNYLAPHASVGGGGSNSPPVPHESHEHDFDGLQATRSEAFNEEDISDKPAGLQPARMSPKRIARTDLYAETRAETLQSVDDGMMAIREELDRNGVLENTNVVFVSDNGFMLGEHRIPQGKVWGYEPSAKVPLLMAGPDVPASGVVRSRHVGLHDLASTITSWHGLGPMPGADGVPLFAGRIPRRDILLQGTFENDAAISYTGLRTPNRHKYLEYGSGEVELYDLAADPQELQNLAEQPAYAELRATLAARLDDLRDCAGASCLRR